MNPVTGTKEAALTKTDVVSHLVVLNIPKLPEELRLEVEQAQSELRETISQFGKSGLKIGEVLSRMRNLLKPHRLWFAFINTLPGMSAKTADRFINRFLIGQQNLPPAVLNLAMVSGINIAGESAKEPYGRYTKAVEAVGRPPKDPNKASQWLSQVVAKQTESRARVRSARGTPAKVSTETVAALLNKALEQQDEGARGEFLFSVLNQVVSKFHLETLLSRGFRSRLKAA